MSPTYRPKVAVFTSIYGGYDTLKPQIKQSIPCDFLCFTDEDPIVAPLPDEKQEYEKWIVTKVKPLMPGTPCMSAKWFKVMSHRVLPGYDITLWIDGTAVITNPKAVETLINRIGTSQLGLFSHPFRHCIHSEADHCKDFAKYTYQPIISQAANYLDQGIYFNEGLWACGVLLRNGECAKFNTLWWEEIKKWTTQDQISFPYAARKSGLDFRTFHGNVFNNPYVSCDLTHLKG